MDENNFLEKQAVKGQLVTVINQLNKDLNVYSTFTKDPPSDPPSTNAADYYPVYTLIGSVSANGQSQVTTIEVISRLVITYADTEFPVKLFVPPFLEDSPQVQITEADLQNCLEGQRFYKDFMVQLYSPLSLQYREILLHTKDISSFETTINKFFADSDYRCDYFAVNMLTYWYANAYQAYFSSLYYYCYKPSQVISGEFFTPKTPYGAIELIDSAAHLLVFNPNLGKSQTLKYENNTLSPDPKYPAPGFLNIRMTPIFCRKSLIEDGGNEQIIGCFIGKDMDTGEKIIAYPANYTISNVLPWWLIAYDFAYASFLAVQIYMGLDMAVQVLRGIKSGISYLSGKLNDFYKSARAVLDTQRSEMIDVDTMDLPSIEPVNVDVDVDTDIDIDVDIDTDTNIETNIDIDTVVDVDTDIDIDVDIDVGVIVDIDVDVDTNIDIDTETNVDIDVVDVVDTVEVTDIDTDIDTDINIETGGIKNILSSIGNWVVNKAFPELVKFLAIQFNFETADKLLAIWKQAGVKEELDKIAPPDTSALGLLINYMFNERITSQARWETFADYVEQAKPDNSAQKLLLASILMTKNQQADNAAKNWGWYNELSYELINQMSYCQEDYLAYQKLATYLYKDQALPIKTACGVAIRYLNLKKTTTRKGTSYE